jgi:hypothetical protein
MVLKIEFKKIKMAYRLIRDIKGYHVLFCSSSDLSIEKNMSGTSEWVGVAFLSKAVRYDDEGRV